MESTKNKSRCRTNVSDISIIVPVYQSEQYLPQCIESILAQTFSNFELILVDDGSSDHSGNICDEYARKDARIRVIHQANAGVSAARNAGLDAAVGTYVMFCDSDDWVDPDWCQCLYDGISRDDVVMAMCGYRNLNDQHELLSLNTMEAGVVFLKDWILQSIAWSSCNKIFVRDVIETHHIRFLSNFSRGEDAMFFWSYLEVHGGEDQYRIVENGLYNYRIHEHGLSHRHIVDDWENGCAFIEKQVQVSKVLEINMEEYENYFSHQYFILVFGAMKDVFSDDNTISWRKKYRRLKAIVNSKECERALTSQDIDSCAKWFRFLLKQRITPAIFFYYWIKS